MDKQIITFSANEQNLVRIGGEYHYSSNKVSYIGAHFDLGANWDGFDSVRAVWFTDRINGISTVLDGEGNCTVPTEVLKKKDRVFVNLVGSIVSNGELTDRLTTYPAVALVVDSKAKVDSTETAPVTPSQFEQFVSIVQDAVANIKDIVSTTLNADYTLTFVYSDGTSYTTPSIRGERGPQGADGADGTDGNGIASAVLNSNYTLTLTFTDGTSYTTPSIRGAQGPKGDPGDVSQAQLDAAVSDLKSDLNTVYGEYVAIPRISEWIDGEYIKLDGTIGISGTYHRTDYIEIDPVLGGIVFTNSGGNYDTDYNAWYDSSKNFISSFATERNGTIEIIPPQNAKYMRLSFNKTTVNTIQPKLSLADIRYYFSNVLEEYCGLFNPLAIKWENRIYYYGSGVWSPSPSRIGLQYVIIAKNRYRVSVQSGYKYAIFRFSSTTPSTSSELSNTGWITEDAIIEKGDIFLINMSKTDDSNLSPSESQNLSIVLDTGGANDIGNNYVVGSDLLKKGVSISLLGTLTYEQSFCKYDGNYYSIDGSHISVQNSLFTQTDSADLDTGHGNSLQLGNGNIAYASGWNDNKIYAVDLDNLTIDSIITLPTTGYTTGVVDEVRELAYIFQRDSYPDHEDNYNFIVYDIANEQILSSKKILAFGAMQACDFFNDRIIVLNGLGNSTCPNGYRVFDTSGNVLADYFLGQFSTQEPEGICIDRDNHELLISYLNKNIYKIS